MKKKKCNCYEFSVCNICQKVFENDKDRIPLTFDELRKVNVARCEKDIRPINDWSPLEWGGAMAGEAGELCNFLKKMKRGAKVKKKDLAHELADVITYADLIAAQQGIDLGEAIREKFNIVSKRWNSKYKL
jgi:NTP pyrophosphatase (non-canonical NTP hydrolase)